MKSMNFIGKSMKIPKKLEKFSRAARADTLAKWVSAKLLSARLPCWMSKYTNEISRVWLVWVISGRRYCKQFALSEIHLAWRRTSKLI